MNAAIIFVIGAIGLTGCTATGLQRSVEGSDSGFPPTYPGGKAEYPSSTSKNVLVEVFNRNNTDKQAHPALIHKSSDVPTSTNNLARIIILPKNMAQALAEQDKHSIAFIGVKMKNGNINIISRYGQVNEVPRSVVELFHPPEDVKEELVCEPPMIPPMEPGMKAEDCWCQWKESGDGGGLNQHNAHMHCY